MTEIMTATLKPMEIMTEIQTEITKDSLRLKD
jgi:hypothetical protein